MKELGQHVYLKHASRILLNWITRLTERLTLNTFNASVLRFSRLTRLTAII